MSSVRKVRVMINPNSGPISMMKRLYELLERYWNVDGFDLTYQVSRDADDGRGKTRRAVDDGVEIMLVAGGDGMVNSIGRELVGSDTALGVIPTGSGNGFARHFAIPLDCGDAIRSLRDAQTRKIDVATLNGRPFFVTASMAWDAALVEHFERSPVRGILPYVFAGVYGYFDYVPQSVDLEFGDGEQMHIDKPLILTAANLTQYGGGAIIAPHAHAEDGLLELISITKSPANLLANLAHLFDGTLGEHQSVTTRKFSHLKITRAQAAPVQLDGELMDAPETIEIGVLAKSLKVLVPAATSS